MFLYDRARDRARWGRIVPLVVLSILLGIGAAFAISTAELLPRWAVTPLGNSLGLVLVWMWLPNAFQPIRRLSLRTRLLGGLASAVIFVWAMIAASWQYPFWLR
ncbi:MAG: hypothetical protein ACT4PM_11215 [Gemmatimonadales bacterium]